MSDIVQLQKEADAHFSSLKCILVFLSPFAVLRYAIDLAGEFLDTEAGKPYRDIFKGIRFQHIINDASSVRILDRESIIPQCKTAEGKNNQKTKCEFAVAWLLPLYKKQWQKMLKVNQKQDHG